MSAEPDAGYGGTNRLPAKTETGPTADKGAKDGIPAQSAASPNAAPGAPGISENLPSVPALPTVENIVEYLGELGIRAENNRPKGGALWVRQGKAEFGRIAEHLVKSGVGVRHYPTGTQRHPKECYEIDPGKKLG